MKILVGLIAAVVAFVLFINWLSQQGQSSSDNSCQSSSGTSCVSNGGGPNPEDVRRVQDHVNEVHIRGYK